MEGTPTSEQWEKIKKRVSEIGNDPDFRRPVRIPYTRPSDPWPRPYWWEDKIMAQDTITYSRPEQAMYAAGGAEFKGTA